MTTRSRIQKAREARFVKSLEEARETLDSVIEQAEQRRKYHWRDKGEDGRETSLQD